MESNWTPILKELSQQKQLHAGNMFSRRSAEFTAVRIAWKTGRLWMPWYSKIAIVLTKHLVGQHA